MRICPLCSGSGGNASFIEAGDTRLLVDAGVSCRKLCALLEDIGVRPETLSAILITHEHIDHVRGAAVLSKRFGLPIFANRACHQAMYSQLSEVSRANIRVFESDEPFMFGQVEILPFSTPHDAAHSVGYRITHRDKSLTIMTDIGKIDERLLHRAAGCSLVLIEANHDVDMLMAGAYPYPLKQRILSPMGHLCNEDCARAAVELAKTGTRTFVLGHLSRENNYPPLALAAVRAELNEAGFMEEIVVAVAERETPSGFFEVA
ncbi:MAG: MBL fold metallo-hydrolase [Clostridia bacterium]|nr:MBL fold metallo-hydrolase [Clostridia bacterium]